MSTDDPRSRAWVEVDAGALRRNLRRVQDAAGRGARVLPMVKADAYGLGAEGAVRVLEAFDPWGYGVAAVGEGIALRAFGVSRRVLVFSPLAPGAYVAAAVHGLTPCISQVEALDGWGAAVAEAGSGGGAFHVEVDTGMGRAGLAWDRADAWGAAVADRARAHGLRWEGVYTHFHSADEAGGERSVAEQWRRFLHAVARLPDGGAGLTLHAANSAAVFRYPDAAADLVRPGIFLYGGGVGPDLPEPEPVVSVRARVVLVREVEAGTTVGYGATHTAGRAARWATLAIGYGDGLPRALGNRGSALLRGRRVPLIGRTSMDLSVVDVTDVPGVEVGDVATLIGRDGDEEVPLAEVAGLAGTIDYEILTGLGSRLPRLWTSE
ncbi:MAG: alanine racemase [Gemmatimonadetes bacterium]|nr:MAG: alanine racemase [Gemmatimonadota bacterium]